MARWVIDAAYGEKENGYIGKKGRTEKSVTLDAAIEAMKVLKLNDEEVFLIRSNDSYIELDDRIDWTKKWKADYYICFAMNFDEDENITGTHMYIKSNNEASRELGNIISADMALAFRNSKNEVEEKEDYILNKLEIPSVICLGDFISNINVENNFDAKKIW